MSNLTPTPISPSKKLPLGKRFPFSLPSTLCGHPQVLVPARQAPYHWVTHTPSPSPLETLNFFYLYSLLKVTRSSSSSPSSDLPQCTASDRKVTFVTRDSLKTQLYSTKLSGMSFVLFPRVSCSPDWLQTWYTAWDDLKVLILLCLLPKGSLGYLCENLSRQKER